MESKVSNTSRRGFSLRHVRLSTRLTLLMLIIALPLILMTGLTINNVAESRLARITSEQLQQTNTAHAEKAELWVRFNTDILKQLASFDAVISMDPGQQLPLLEKTGQAFPDMFLIHTLNPAGFDLARSDGQANRDYSDRGYFHDSLAGDVASQSLISRTTNRPALAIAVPIRDAAGSVVGVMTAASDLGVIAQDLIPEEGQAQQQNGMITFMVDTGDRLVAHPQASLLLTDSGELADFGNHPAVKALRSGTRGQFIYTDAAGKRFNAFLSELSNGWGVITEQPAELALSTLNTLRRMTWAVTGVAALVLALLVYIVIRRSLAPISTLTTRAAAVAAGDLYQNVPVQRLDEIGELSASFNTMTEQLRGLVGTLEQRVEERTRAVELSAEVSRRLATILDPDELVREVVEQLQGAFNYYHVHIYLYDENGENLVMAGGTGEAGRAMLARGHKIPRGRGLVGRAASSNLPVLVEDTAQDPNWLPNPLLPQTKSEVAVPIAVGEQVLGVLDVQQNRVGGLGQHDVELIQAIANQVAVATQNARAFSSVQRQAEREAVIAAVNQRIQRSTTIEEALQVAVSELGQALSAKSARVELRTQQTPNVTKN